jgi:hypothetical protein
MLHIGTEHLQGSAAGIDLVVMGELEKAFAASFLGKVGPF